MGFPQLVSLYQTNLANSNLEPSKYMWTKKGFERAGGSLVIQNKKIALELSIYVVKFDSSPKNAKSVPPLLCSRSAYLSASSSRKQFIACRPLLARSHLQIISTRWKDGVCKDQEWCSQKKDVFSPKLKLRVEYLKIFVVQFNFTFTKSHTLISKLMTIFIR